MARNRDETEGLAHSGIKKEARVGNAGKIQPPRLCEGESEATFFVGHTVTFFNEQLPPCHNRGGELHT